MATRLGLHVTAEELAIWQSRAASGPYKTAGDVSTNSPGDWTRIAANAATFKNGSHPYEQWAGQTVNSCVQPGNNLGIINNFTLGTNMRDAAFYYLVTGDTAYSDAVRTDLLAQAAVAGADFSNRSRWCQNSPFGPITDENPSFEITSFINKLLFAYDYTKGTFSAGQKTTMETWFSNAATYWAQQVDRWLVDAKFPGRDTDDYSSPTDSGIGVDPVPTHLSGFTTDGWTTSWSNRTMAHLRLAGLVGIMLNDSYLKAQAKRLVKEYIKYEVFSDNTIGEFYRWRNGTGAAKYDKPCLGWNYASLIVGSVMTLANAFARIGDLDLYQYSTSTGYNGTAGGPKTILGMATLWAQHVNHDVLRYGTDTSTNQTGREVDTVDGISGEIYADDCNLAIGNIYYQDTYLKSVYRRTVSGAPAYPASPTGSWVPWCGEWGIYPGVLFMWGNLEGTVNPYSLASLAPNAPSGLTVNWV